MSASSNPSNPERDETVPDDLAVTGNQETTRRARLGASTFPLGGSTSGRV